MGKIAISCRFYSGFLLTRFAIDNLKGYLGDFFASRSGSELRIFSFSKKSSFSQAVRYLNGKF